MFAVRNPDLCTKECLCLYVCPTGATSTEDGTIDADKCIDGCRLCVDVCPEHAIYLVPERYPDTQPPPAEIAAKVRPLLHARAALRTHVAAESTQQSDPALKRLFEALEMSCRILGEDCVRALGYMLPQEQPLAEFADAGVFAQLTGDEGEGCTAATEILQRVLTSVQENRDAEDLVCGVCTQCGAIYTVALPEACSRCDSTEIETIS